MNREFITVNCSVTSSTPTATRKAPLTRCTTRACLFNRRMNPVARVISRAVSRNGSASPMAYTKVKNKPADGCVKAILITAPSSGPIQGMQSKDDHQQTAEPGNGFAVLIERLAEVGRRQAEQQHEDRREASHEAQGMHEDMAALQLGIPFNGASGQIAYVDRNQRQYARGEKRQGSGDKRERCGDTVCIHVVAGRVEFGNPYYSMRKGCPQPAVPLDTMRPATDAAGSRVTPLRFYFPD